MKKLENCRFCGNEFISEHGQRYCSEGCRVKAYRQHWKKNGERTRRGISGLPDTRICPVCGTQFEGTRTEKYCSDKCRSAARKKRNDEYFPEWYRENKKEVVQKVMERRKKDG